MGTFAFGLSGGLAGVRARLDVFGVAVLAVVVGLTGGITRDLLIGRRASRSDPCDAYTSPLRFEGHGWTGGIGIFDQGTQTSANIALERPLG